MSLTTDWCSAVKREAPTFGSWGVFWIELLLEALILALVAVVAIIR